MKTLSDNIMKKITLEHCVIRFIMAWCFVSLIQTFFSKIKIDNIEFVGTVNLGLSILSTIVLFVALYTIFEVLQKDIIEKAALVAVTFLYAFVTITEYNDIYFTLAMIGMMLFSVNYAVKDMEQLKIKKWMYITIACVSVAIFVGFTGTYLAVRYLSYSAPNFDHGLFSQMFYNMKTNFSMNTTLERDRLLSHMAVHVSPIFYVLLPVYAIFSSPITLEIAQVIVLAAALIPLLKICSNHGMTRFEKAAVAVMYSFYPVVSSGCFYDFHENIFLPVCIFSLIYFMEKDKNIGIIISALATFAVKEDAPIYVAFIALFFIVGQKKYKKGAMLFAGAVLYFAIINLLLVKFGLGVMSNRFNNMIYGGDGNMIGIIKTIWANPAYILTQMFNKDKLTYIIQVLAPLLFIPFFSKRWQTFILAGPFVMFNLMTSYVYMYDINFQYTFGSAALLIYMVIINVSQYDTKVRKRVIPMLSISSVLMFVSIVGGRKTYIESYNNEYNQKTYEVMNEALELIPDDASVIASTFLCAHLADREEIYEIYYTDKKAEYVALDLRGATTDYNVNDYLNNDDYETVFYDSVRIAIFRNKKM